MLIMSGNLHVRRCGWLLWKMNPHFRLLTISFPAQNASARCFDGASLLTERNIPVTYGWIKIATLIFRKFFPSFCLKSCNNNMMVRGSNQWYGCHVIRFFKLSGKTWTKISLAYFQRCCYIKDEDPDPEDERYTVRTYKISKINYRSQLIQPT